MAIKKCRICHSSRLTFILDLGKQAFTGVFPEEGEAVERGRLELVRCSRCGLVQLSENFDLAKMYGSSYGYRSGLNQSMVNHLRSIVEKVLSLDVVSLNPHLYNQGLPDVVVDIGSNDGTLLNLFPETLELIGVDPTIKKFGRYYETHIVQVPKFFSKGLIKKKAKVVTSIAMLYDLHDPLSFFQGVFDLLGPEGVWITEQCYLPTMINNLTYDTICHEHVEYYGLTQIKWLADEVGFKVLDVELNEVNGGSFCATMAKRGKPYPIVDSLLEREKRLNHRAPFIDFAKRVKNHRRGVKLFFNWRERKGELVLGYGASTKGNVLLQHCDLSPKQIPYIGEINSDKFGKVTPGTRIPIIPEEIVREMKPDYLFVLPWHFREGFIKKEEEYLKSGGHLVFPLPKKLEII